MCVICQNYHFFLAAEKEKKVKSKTKQIFLYEFIKNHYLIQILILRNHNDYFFPKNKLYNFKKQL